MMEYQPNNLDEAVDLLMKWDNLTDEQKLEHHGFGTALRNGWNLWWNFTGQGPKPAIVEWFNQHQLYHGDDLSGAIQEAYKARKAGKEFDIEKYKNRIQKHWKQWGGDGCKDGIIIPEYI